MTETVPDVLTVAARRDAAAKAATHDTDGDGADADVAVNGAVVLRPRRRGAAGGRGSGRQGDGGAGLSLRDRVDRLRMAAVTELERRHEGAALEPADSVPVPVRQLSSLSRELPRLMREAPHLLGQATEAARSGAPLDAVRGVFAFLGAQRRLAARAVTGVDSTDDFGFDEEWTESLLPFFRWLFKNYWRVQLEGVENIPASGRALLVSNHAGVLPYDGAMIRVAVFDAHPAQRHVRALILNAFFGIPVASWFLRRTGNTLAHPDDAERLLERDELVLVFPEGAKGTGKAYSDRYRLRRFGRGGFVNIALHTGAPIIPVSVVGSEEVHPMIANLTPLANALGMPYFPLTPTFPALGPLGLIPLPSSWIISFHKPIDIAAHGSAAANDAALVMDLSDLVRDTIQAGLYEQLEERGSVFA